MLLRTLLEILQDWQVVFPRKRSYRRAVCTGTRHPDSLRSPYAVSCHLGAGT